jgi:hypothetical protein
MARGVLAVCALNGAKAGAAVLIFCGLVTASRAQPVQQKSPPGSQIETVTVTGVRIPAEVIHAFVQSYARLASSSVEEITRWKKPICVGTEGLAAEDLNQFVTERINQIAAQSGVPVGVHPCNRNVEIRFTSDPQGFLDQVRLEGPALLTPKRSRVKEVAVMRYPVQAWYATGIEDRNGTLILNDEESVGIYGGGNPGSLNVFNTAPTMNVEGSLLRSGLNARWRMFLSSPTAARPGISGWVPSPIMSPCWHSPRRHPSTNAGRSPASPTCSRRVAATPSSRFRSPTPISPFSGDSIR